MDDQITRGPYNVRIIEDRWSTVRHIVEAVAIVAAGVWAFYTFVYTERIKPQLETPTAQFSVTFDRGHARGPIDEATFTITATNAGRADIDIIVEAFSVFGEKLGTTPQKKIRDTPPYALEDDRTLPVTKTVLLYTSGFLRTGARNGRAGRHVVLRPTEHFDFRLPISWPRGRFDDLTLEYRFGYDRFPTPRKIDVRLVRRADGSIDIKRNSPGGFFADVGSTYFL